MSIAHAADIPRAQLQTMFDQISRDTKWDLKKPLLWGYFFTHPTRDALEKAAPLLTARGYRLVDIRLGERQSPSDPDTWWLHVERIEIHTVDSLDARNRDLDAFAKEHGINNYDGMDVGPAPNQ
jgi:hypothetical protein